MPEICGKISFKITRLPPFHPLQKNGMQLQQLSIDTSTQPSCWQTALLPLLSPPQVYPVPTSEDTQVPKGGIKPEFNCKKIKCKTWSDNTKILMVVLFLSLDSAGSQFSPRQL